MIQRINTVFCSILLIAMSLAVGHHWWTQQHPGNPLFFSKAPIALVQEIPVSPPKTHPAPEVSPLPSTEPAPAATAQSTTPPAAQQEFYQSLIKQIANLQNQNRDLVDQLAETNRELMKLEFRVDTHSSQFRPLPVNEERQDTTLDESFGVLPPRPMVVDEGFSTE